MQKHTFSSTFTCLLQKYEKLEKSEKYTSKSEKESPKIYTSALCKAKTPKTHFLHS